MCFYCTQSDILLCGVARFSWGNKNKLSTCQFQKWKKLRAASLKQNLLVLIKKRVEYKLPVPIINLSNYNLSSQETQQLKLGLDYFVDKYKYLRGSLAANMEPLVDTVKDNMDHKNLEHFREFLRGYKDIFTNNIYATKDYTYITSVVWFKIKTL